MIAAAPAALAECPATSVATPIEVSSFSFSRNPSRTAGPTLCLSVAPYHKCDPQETCCLGSLTAPATKIAKLTITNTNYLCTDYLPKRKELLWTVNSRKKTPKFFGSEVTLPVGLSGAVTVCVTHLGPSPECEVDQLFDRPSGVIYYQITTAKATKKPDLTDKSTWSKVSCCLFGQIAYSNLTCSVKNGGCLPTATCTEANGTTSCTCKSGYTGDGLSSCDDVNECITYSPCSANASCTNTDGGYSCKCLPGFVGDGVSCIADGCGVICPQDTTCTNTTSGNATCQCSPGLTGDGAGNCTDVNECLTNNGGCHPDANCRNLRGSFFCTCKPGFTGDGLFNCSPSSSRFKITLVNVGKETKYDDVFKAAAGRWQQIILTDLANFSNPDGVDLTRGRIENFTYTGPVDDVIIFHRTAPIDGPGKVLGSAGPLVTRRSDGTPISGRMTFDSDDIDRLSPEDLNYVILHEMAHVLGVGSTWTLTGCLDPASCEPGTDSFAPYLCGGAQREFNAAGCEGRLPVETLLGPGSACSHFREKTLINELMTPSLQSGQYNALSRITIGAMEDVYGSDGVDYSTADPYTCPSPAEQARAESSRLEPLGEFVVEMPVGTEDV